MHETILKQAKREISGVLDRYGLTWQQLYFDMTIPQDDLKNYDNPKKIKSLLRGARIAHKNGALLHSLPESIERFRQ